MDDEECFCSGALYGELVRKMARPGVDEDELLAKGLTCTHGNYTENYFRATCEKK